MLWNRSRAPGSSALTDDIASIQALNARIAEGYNMKVYDPDVVPQVEVARLQGLAAVFGCSRPARDVLDLGCGRGRQLAWVGEQVDGRVVGVDLAGSACDTARQRCAHLGQRAEILCADLLDLALSALPGISTIII